MSEAHYLSAAAIRQLHDAGWSVERYLAATFPNGLWLGSGCGCPYDTECENHHHIPGEDGCHCLRSHLDVLTTARIQSKRRKP